jgi:hypothetical protein
MAHHGRPEDVDGAQCEAARLIKVCCCCGQEGATEPHHEPPVSQGGLDTDAVPLLVLCHRRRHDVGARKFWRDAQMDPDAAKEALRDWMNAGYPQAHKPW